MKAKDLAALLLQTPDLEVYIEDYHCPDFDDGYHYTNGTTGVTRTPDGIFIDIDSVNHYPKAPSERPRIGTISIMMTDGEPFKLRQDDQDLSVLQDYVESGYICNYIGWHENYYILAPNDIEDDWVREHIEDASSTHYTPDEVDYVQILVGLEEETWNPIYIQLSFDEAIKYAMEKKNG